MIGGRAVLEKEHKVDVLPAGGLDLTGGIETLGICIDKDLKKRPGRVAGPADPLERGIETGKVKTVDDSIYQSDGIIFGDQNFDIQR